MMVAITGNESHDAFLEKAYRETYDLLVDVRDYVAGGPAAEGEEIAAQQKLQLTYELSRITGRLTDVMAWLMIRKAVAAGEIGEEEAAAQSTAPSAFEDPPEVETDPAALPLAARGLIDRMRRLEADVRRLEVSFEARSAG
jgi:regulator of CtrA degradation